MRRALVSLCVVAILAVACGEKESPISAAASELLGAQVAQLRTAAAAGDQALATATLVSLRKTVAEMDDSGEIGESAASEVLAAAADVEAKLALIPTTTVVTTPPTTALPAVTEPDGEAGDEGDRGKGRDNGKGKDDDDD